MSAAIPCRPMPLAMVRPPLSKTLLDGRQSKTHRHSSCALYIHLRSHHGAHQVRVRVALEADWWLRQQQNMKMSA